jgi:hypothetical protein
MGSCFIFHPVPSAAVLSRINYADYPLAARMNMNVSDFNGLLVTAPVLRQARALFIRQASRPSSSMQSFRMFSSPMSQSL